MRRKREGDCGERDAEGDCEENEVWRGEERRLWANGFGEGEQGRGLWRKGRVEEEGEGKGI